jgi:hypothetical protein
MTNKPGDPFPTSRIHDAVWPVRLRLTAVISSTLVSGIKLCHAFSAKEYACNPQYVMGAPVLKGLAIVGDSGWPPTTRRCVSVNTHCGFNTGMALAEGNDTHDA